jgi:MoaD family protein
MPLHVKVRLLGTFRKLLGKNHVAIELKEPISVRCVIQKLGEDLSDEFKRAIIDHELDDPRPNALLLVNGREISALNGLETKVYDNDEIVIVPVTHGG